MVGDNLIAFHTQFYVSLLNRIQSKNVSIIFYFSLYNKIKIDLFYKK